MNTKETINSTTTTHNCPQSNARFEGAMYWTTDAISTKASNVRAYSFHPNGIWALVILGQGPNIKKKVRTTNGTTHNLGWETKFDSVSPKKRSTLRPIFAINERNRSIEIPLILE
jgi:hypothetical protein